MYQTESAPEVSLGKQGTGIVAQAVAELLVPACRYWIIWESSKLQSLPHFTSRTHKEALVNPDTVFATWLG